MPDYRISGEARQDLEGIFVFGLSRWGLTQTDDYQRALYRTFDLLAANPWLAPERGPVPGIRIRPHRSHIIAYAPMDTGVLILRILHGRSDWRALLA